MKYYEYEIFIIYALTVGWSRASKGGNDQCGTGPVNCYSCSSDTSDVCADPLNSTSIHHLKVLVCNGSCVKWVRTLESGVLHYSRTCSESLNLKMPVFNVCMQESRPADGVLCFCNRHHCNSSPPSLNLTLWHSVLPVLLTVYLCLLPNQVSL